jgi:hypothetical protein
LMESNNLFFFFLALSYFPYYIMVT